MSTISPRKAIVPIGPSIAYIELSQGLYALVDSSDAAWLEQWNWHAFCNPRSGAYYARRSPTGMKQVYMHTSLWELPEGQTADHVDPARTLDNRRCNTRPASRHQQALNRRKKVTSASNLKGVSQIKATGRWVAKATISGKRVHLGCFATEEQAHAAYRNAADKHYGEFKRLA